MVWVCPFDREGGGLKLFGQCHIEPTHLKKGLPIVPPEGGCNVLGDHCPHCESAFLPQFEGASCVCPPCTVYLTFCQSAANKRKSEGMERLQKK